MSLADRGFVANLSQREKALGQDWLLPVAPVTTTREMVRLIGQEIGQAPQVLNVPSIVQAKALGIFDETFASEYEELFYQYTEVVRSLPYHLEPFIQACWHWWVRCSRYCCQQMIP